MYRYAKHAAYYIGSKFSRFGCPICFQQASSSSQLIDFSHYPAIFFFKHCPGWGDGPGIFWVFIYSLSQTMPQTTQLLHLPLSCTFVSHCSSGCLKEKVNHLLLFENHVIFSATVVVRKVAILSSLVQPQYFFAPRLLSQLKPRTLGCILSSVLFMSPYSEQILD